MLGRALGQFLVACGTNSHFSLLGPNAAVRAFLCDGSAFHTGVIFLLNRETFSTKPRFPLFLPSSFLMQVLP